MNKQQKELRRLVFKALDTIETACKGMAKEWKQTDLPIPTFFAVLDKARWDSNTKLKDAKRFAINYNKMLDAIKDSVAMHRSIEVDAIGVIINKIKASFDEGVSKTI